MTTVLICDDQPQVRDVLGACLASLPGVDLVVGCASGEELLADYPRCNPDLVLLDTQLAGRTALDTVRSLLRAHPEAHVLMLTSRADRERAAAAVAAGARGFLAKGGTHTGFASAVAGALAGRDLLDPVNGQRPPADPAAAQSGPALTERELQVLRGMSRGRSNAEIGRALYLSEDTIKTHARRLFRKLGVNDRAQAVALGFRRGLVS